MGGSSSSGNTSKTKRYAPYIENRHSVMLADVASNRAAVIDLSPWAAFPEYDAEDAFFAEGWLLANFPTLYEMFGKFMAGLDIEALWSAIFERMYEQGETNNVVSSESSLSRDSIKVTEANFMLQMRELNAVESSSFVIGRAQIERNWLKDLAKLSADLKYDIIVTAENTYTSSLNWKKQVIDTYASTIKLYYLATIQSMEENFKAKTRDALWGMEVLDFERSALGAYNPLSYYTKMGVRKRSTLSKTLLVLSYTATGASIGSSILPGWGTAIGAVIGFVVGLAIMLFE